MLDRPFLQPHRHVVAAFELERGLLRHLDRSRDEMTKSAGAIKGFLAVAIIEDDAETRGIAGRRPRRPIDQRLEARDLLARLPATVGEPLELAAMIEGEHGELRRLRPCVVAQ